MVGRLMSDGCLHGFGTAARATGAYTLAALRLVPVVAPGIGTDSGFGEAAKRPTPTFASKLLASLLVCLATLHASLPCYFSYHVNAIWHRLASLLKPTWLPFGSV